MLYEIITPDPSSTAWNLTGGHPLDVISLDGAGIPNIVRREQEFANQSGALDYGYRLQPRDMTLKLFYNATDKATEDGIRDTIYKIFRPYDYPLKLRCTRPDGAVRQIDCHTVGTMDLPESERIGASLAFAVRLRAPNPIWYNATQQTHSYTPSASGVSTTVTYAGGWEEFPIIKLYGYMEYPVLQHSFYTPDGTVTYNMNFQSTVSGVGSAIIPDGDVWTIDLRPGYKTVTNAAGDNKLAFLLTAINNLMEFRLLPAPIEVGGANAITLIYSAKNSNARMDVLYYTRYLGL